MMMTADTRILFLSTVFFVPIITESQYECGAHGRFEYCIDDIPGCIIGCHCHPGYYFDTESKICEPNIKLTQNYRRQYLPEPTRVTEAPIASKTEQQTTSNAVDNKLDEITKDADDLGDWLYNQFFKTIENQVYNKTQGEETLPTRRSGDILLKKPSRRSHRKGKRKKKRSKRLKSKLLRITEDDSLFDSTDSDDSTYEDYSYSTSESEEDTSDRSKRKHGHKKIVIMNKGPKVPLPSFIFMPNTDMDTPYYPPIGLAPPPAVPMYPMVPVPPMMPGPLGLPLFPYPGVPHGKDDVTSTPASTSTATYTTTAATQETETDLPTPTTEPTQSETPPNLRLKHKKRIKPTGKPNFELMGGNTNRQLMKRLREKLNRKRKLENFIADQYQGLEAPIVENGPAGMISKGDLTSSDVLLPPPDVDFKYLADLIHKADLNKTLRNGSNPKTSALQNNPIAQQPGRRSYYQTNNMNNYMKKQRSRVGNTNDLFYTNLGKQIASLIRKIDSKEQREVNINIEGSASKQHSPIFNENNFASRSFWERSVRSPLKYINSIKKEMDYLKKSNEDLFSLENRVEIAASATPKLSLHDLENIIRTVQKVKFIKPIRNNEYRKTSDHSNASFKLNLFPENKAIETIQPVITPKQIQSVIQKDEDIINKHSARKQQTDSNNLILSNFRQLSPDYDEAIRRTGTGIDLFQNLEPTIKPNEYIPSDSRTALPLNHITNNMSTFVKKTTNKSNIKYQLSPVLMNHRKLNYHYKSNNPYLFETAQPIQYSRISNNLAPYGKVEKPSYFHHEFHHFDYFDK